MDNDFASALMDTITVGLDDIAKAIREKNREVIVYDERAVAALREIVKHSDSHENALYIAEAALKEMRK